MVREDSFLFLHLPRLFFIRSKGYRFRDAIVLKTRVIVLSSSSPALFDRFFMRGEPPARADSNDAGSFVTLRIRTSSRVVFSCITGCVCLSYSFLFFFFFLRSVDERRGCIPFSLFRGEFGDFLHFFFSFNTTRFFLFLLKRSLRTPLRPGF